QRINRNAAKLAYCISKCRSQNISHPAETFYDFLGVCSETEYLSDSFVHGAVRFVSVCHVLYNKHCHVRRCNTAHRSHRIDMVAWHKYNFSGFQKLSCVRFVVPPFLKEDSSHTGTL